MVQQDASAVLKQADSSGILAVPKLPLDSDDIFFSLRGGQPFLRNPKAPRHDIPTAQNAILCKTGGDLRRNGGHRTPSRTRAGLRRTGIK